MVGFSNFFTGSLTCFPQYSTRLFCYEYMVCYLGTIIIRICKYILQRVYKKTKTSWEIGQSRSSYVCRVISSFFFPLQVAKSLNLLQLTFPSAAARPWGPFQRRAAKKAEERLLPLGKLRDSVTLAVSATRIYLDFSMIIQTVPTFSERHKFKRSLFTNIMSKSTFFPLELEEDGSYWRQCRFLGFMNF